MRAEFCSTTPAWSQRSRCSGDLDEVSSL